MIIKLSIAFKEIMIKYVYMWNTFLLSANKKVYYTFKQQFEKKTTNHCIFALFIKVTYVVLSCESHNYINSFCHELTGDYFSSTGHIILIPIC